GLFVLFFGHNRAPPFLLVVTYYRHKSESEHHKRDFRRSPFVAMLAIFLFGAQGRSDREGQHPLSGTIPHVLLVTTD
ncbi:MAG: hypothetical protein RSC58_08920, partial [Ruthenibacterium sp.]